MNLAGRGGRSDPGEAPRSCDGTIMPLNPGSAGIVAGTSIASSKTPAGRDAGVPGRSRFMGSTPGPSAVHHAHEPGSRRALFRIYRSVGRANFGRCRGRLKPVLRTKIGSWEASTAFRSCKMPMNLAFWLRTGRPWSGRFMGSVHGHSAGPHAFELTAAFTAHRSPLTGKPPTINLQTINPSMGRVQADAQLSPGRSS
jgi:hypothetical protein